MPSPRKAKSFSLVQVSCEENVAEIRLHRPEAMNAFNVELATELGLALQAVAKDRNIRAVILRGSGRVFSAGGDLKMFHALLPRADRGFKKISTLLSRAIEIIRTMPKPVIAGLNGPAFAAAFGLTLSCDLILATPSARLSASFIKIGLCPNGSASFFLPRLVGWHRALECLLTGKILTAHEAYEWGIVNRLVEEDEFDSALWAWAKSLSQMPTKAIARMKLLLNRSLETSLSKQLEQETQAIVWSATTKDFAEGVTAFVEKRTPRFQGK